MYSIDEKILQAYEANSREIYVKATFNNTVVVTGDKIKSFTVTDSVGNTDSLSLGNACSKKLELDMFVPDNLTSIAKAKIKIEVGIDVDGTIEYTPLGIFYVDDYKTANDYKSVKITAFDAMLKIYEELGDSYTCGLTATKVAPINVIKDICSQAGVSVSIGTPKVQNSNLYNKPAEGVIYFKDGTKYESLCSIGINELIRIPKTTTSIDVKLFGMAQTDLTYSKFRAAYFKDKDGKSLMLHSEQSSNNFEQTVDFDSNNNPLQYIEGTIYPPKHNGDLYFGFNFDTSAFESLPESLYFEITVYSEETNYVNNDVVISNPQKIEISARDMLGYMAGILGCNAVIDRTGNLTVRKLESTSNIIPYKLQYMDGLEKVHETVLQIEYLTTGSSTDESSGRGVISVGSGSYGFNFENPYITSESVAQNILNLYKDLEILPCNVNYRGNPSIDCGDIISVQDKDLSYYNVLVLNNTISVTGGLSAKIDCGLKTDVKQDFISMPSSKRIEHRVDSFIAAYQDVVDELVGVKGGYVQQVRDNSNVIRALAITKNNMQVKWDETNGKVVAADSSDNGTPMWVWSYGGLSFSPNGGTTYNAAINMSGQIYAEMIVGKLGKLVELQAELGTIGGWNIDSDSLYSDYGDYRVYFQTPTAKKQWVISVQKKVSDDTYSGLFFITATGEVHINSKFFLNSPIIAGKGLEVSNGNSTRMKIEYIGWNFGGIDKDGESVNRDTITSTGAFVLNANGGNNRLYLVGAKIYLRNDTDVDGTLTTNTLNVSSSATINKITLDTSSWTIGSSTADRQTIMSASGLVISANRGNNTLFLDGSHIKCLTDLRLNFHSSSGTIPLVVNSSGEVTATSSSERYKENITDELEDFLNPERLYDLPVVQYNYKNDFKDKELVSGKQIGITAENVEKYYPNALIRNADGQAESWQDRIMIPAMLKLIQEQKKEIEVLKYQQNKTNERLSALDNIITKLSGE